MVASRLVEVQFCTVFGQRGWKFGALAQVKKRTALAPLVNQVNKILHSNFSNVEVYNNIHESYNSNGLYPPKSYISNNFMKAITDYKGVLHCE